MKAITLHRPWPAAIIYCGKRVENRKWRPPESIIGQDLAIHAGRREDEQSRRWINSMVERRQVLGRVLTGFGNEGIVAVVRVQGWLRHPGARSRDEFEEVVRDHGDWVGNIVRSAWWCGPVGWTLDNVRPLALPVPCKGAQGLWTVPANVEAAVVEQIARSA